MDGGCFQRNRSCRLSPRPPIMQMAVGAIREWPLRENGRGLFSGESLMSVVTDTTNHANGGRGDSRIVPTGKWTGAVFRGIAHVGCHRPTNHANGGRGDSRMAPTGDWTGGCFQRNPSCRLSPTPRNMKMAAAGAIREWPLREIGRGLFLEELQGSAPLPPGRRMGAERRRATTRVAPTTGLPDLFS